MSGAGVNNHVMVGGSVALQTAKGIIQGKRDLKVRVLFDCGAHRSFVTKTTKDIAGLNVIRKEWVTITTFGQIEGRPQLMEVVEVNFIPSRERRDCENSGVCCTRHFPSAKRAC